MMRPVRAASPETAPGVAGAEAEDGRPLLAVAGIPLVALAAVNALLHLLVVGRYGYFRDELYYVACGRHLDWGYVDHPPLVALITRLEEALFGTSPLALRLLPILAGSAVVVLAGLLARELGGGRFAQGLAGLAVIVAPTYLFTFHILSMNVFDVLFWTLASWVVARILRRGEPRLWLLFGLVAGVGLENKHSLLFLGFGVFVALVLTPARCQLATPWPWLGGAIAALLLLPNLLWEVRLGWPTLEFIANAEGVKNVHLPPLAFLREQVLMMHPLTAPIWLAGLAGLLFAVRLRPFRLLGLSYLVILAVLLSRAAKPYYLAPAYPVLFAAGAVMAETLARRPGWRWLPATAFALLVLGGAATAPLTLPILGEEAYVRYAAALGVAPKSDEKKAIGPLPQHFADMHGWPEMVAAIAGVYDALPAAERTGARRCAIFVHNYGEAGAIDLLGPAYGLPRAISSHNNYYLWGPGDTTGDCMIVLGDDRERLAKRFAEVQDAAVFHCPWCMPYEDGQTIHVCRGLDVPVAALWPRIKSFN